MLAATKHFFAYGSSDQESFRDAAVRSSFQYLTVPGTIAAYYPEATSAFVHSAEIDYMIDPRTPLFQGHIAEPRASHFSLAALHDDSLVQQMGDPRARTAVTFGASDYSRPDVIASLVRNIVDFQTSFGRGLDPSNDKVVRYRRLLEEALGDAAPPMTLESDTRPPSFILAPYFVSSGSDEWAEVNAQILAETASLDSRSRISPVIAVAGSEVLAGALRRIPEGMAETVFFWVTGFDEREASIPELTRVLDVVAESDSILVNLYGGFYSICMGYAGLNGFNNGLGYSESRAWPQLSATGAAPARYYLRRIHRFVPPRVAQLLVESEGRLQCGCEVCAGQAESGQGLASLGYQALKKHFALSRKWELELCEFLSPNEMRDRLVEEADHFEMAQQRIPERLRYDVDYLRRWSAALDSDRI